MFTTVQPEWKMVVKILIQGKLFKTRPVQKRDI